MGDRVKEKKVIKFFSVIFFRLRRHDLKFGYGGGGEINFPLSYPCFPCVLVSV